MKLLVKRAFLRVKGMTGSAKVLTSAETGEDGFEEAVMKSIRQQTSEVQKAYYYGQLQSTMNVLDWTMKQPNVVPRYLLYLHVL